MKKEITGRVVATECHPNSQKPMIVEHSFSYSQKEAIERFMEDSGYTWYYWRKKFGFKAVKAKLTIEVL